MMIGRVGIAGLFAVATIALAGSPALVGEGTVARLEHNLAGAEARDGTASPQLLPVIAELARARVLEGALGEAAALRRRALDIAVTAFGCDSPNAGAAMTALAALDIDRGRYLDAEPL